MTNHEHLEKMLDHIANTSPFEVHRDESGKPLNRPFDTHLIAADMADDLGRGELARSLRYMADNQHSPSTFDSVERGWTPVSVFGDEGYHRSYAIPDEMHKHLPIDLPGHPDVAAPWSSSMYYPTARLAHDAYHVAHAAWMREQAQKADSTEKALSVMLLG